MLFYTTFKVMVLLLAAKDSVGQVVKDCFKIDETFLAHFGIAPSYNVLSKQSTPEAQL